MRILKGLLLLGVCTLAACSVFAPGETGEQLVKGKSDAREYRYLLLDNGLDVLLVSDGGTDVAAASLDIDVGSGKDPAHRQGLAHFLEHMLFLGTRKYPEPDAYQRFISDNAGQRNAYTSFEHTNYFFSVRPQALEEALDRFADFFVQPLLDEKYVEREKNAVESEYQARMHDEGRRKLDVLKQLMNPQHPFSQFSIGNLETLSSDEKPIREDLLDFYRRYYVADNMALVVSGPQSLDQLESWVRPRFSDVPEARQETVKRIDLQPFADDFLPRVVYIQPEKQLQELSLLFPVPDTKGDYHAKPLQLIGHVLGHEGRNSLLAYLKDKGFAEGLSAGVSLSYDGGEAFGITIALTEKGLQHREQVVHAVFQAIAAVKQEGIPDYVFEELSTMARVRFDYAEPDSPLRYVMHLANNMQQYPKQHVLVGDYLYQTYDKERVAELLSYLVVDNSLVMVTGADFEPQDTSPYHDTPYRVDKLPPAFYRQLLAAKPNPAMAIPGRNPFLPETLTLLDDLPQAQQPEQIDQAVGRELWYKPVDRFRLPRAASYYSIIHGEVDDSARETALLELYVALLVDALNPWVYPAAMAGMGFDLYPHARGLTLKVNGFYDQQDTLLSMLVDKIHTASFGQEQFDRIKQGLIRNWRNADRETPYHKALSVLSVQMRPGVYSPQDKRQAAGALTLADVEQFADRFRRDAMVRAFSNGNISPAQSQAMYRTFSQLVHSYSDREPALKVRRLQQPVHRSIKTRQSDAAYVLYWQGADRQIETQARWMLLAKALEPGFFHQLRTEKQLGYAVFARYNPFMTVPGISFVIQSPVAGPQDLHRHVQDYLQQATGELQHLAPQAFDAYKAAVIEELSQQDKTLGQETDRYWYQLALGNTAFDQRQRQVEALRQLTLSQWREFAATLGEVQRLYAVTTEAPLLPGFVGPDAGEDAVYEYPYVKKLHSL